jgi:hypothetical protein
VRCVVINLEYLRRNPEAGADIVDTIITRIHDSKTVKLSHHVVVVLGALNEDLPGNSTFWLAHYYFMAGRKQRVGASMDKVIRKIVDKAAQASSAGSMHTNVAVSWAMAKYIVVTP